MKEIDSFLSTVRRAFRFPEQVEKSAVEVFKRLSYEIQDGDIRFSNNILYLQNVPSVLRSHIMKDKEHILSLIQEEVKASGYVVKDLR